MNEEKKSTNQKIYLIIITIVTAICIIVGSLIHVVGLFSFPKGSNQLSNMAIDGMESFSRVTVEAQVLEVNVEVGDDYKFSYDCSRQEFVPEFAVEGDTLKIKQNVPKKFTRNNVKSDRAKVFIVVPNEKALLSIIATINVGEVKIKDLNMEICDVKTDVGNVEIENATMENLDAKSSVGNVELEDTNVQEMTAKCEVGNVEIKGGKIGKMMLETEIGDIRIEKLVDYEKASLDLGTELGSIIIDGQKMAKTYQK